MPVNIVFFSQGGSYSASVGGRTYTAQGAFEVSFPAGSQQTISGTFTGFVFTVGFAKGSGSGGAQSGTVRSVSGAGAIVSQCNVSYDNSGSPGTLRSFSMTFSVTSSNTNACQLAN